MLGVIIDGLASGCAYGLLALSMVFVFRTTSTLNFAHGEMATFSTYIMFWLMSVQGLSYVPAFIGTMILSFIFGALLYNLSVRWVSKDAAIIYRSLVTIALLLIVNGLSLGIFGKGLKTVASPFGEANLKIYGDFSLSTWSVGVIVISGLLSFALWAFFKYSIFGIRLRAMAQNKQTAQLHGINANWLFTFSWGLATSIGAIAGVLLAPSLTLHPNMMLSLILYSSTAAVVGGLNNPLGAVVGGMLVGLVENITAVSPLGSTFRSTAVFLFLTIVLIFRPTGIFGERETRKI